MCIIGLHGIETIRKPFYGDGLVSAGLKTSIRYTWLEHTKYVKGLEEAHS